MKERFIPTLLVHVHATVLKVVCMRLQRKVFSDLGLKCEVHERSPGCMERVAAHSGLGK